MLTPEALAYLLDRGEWFAAGFLADEDLPPMRRLGAALALHLEHCRLPEWHGQPLFPSGRYSLWDQGGALWFHYSFPLNFDPARWQTLVDGARDQAMAAELRRAGEYLAGYPDPRNVVPEEFRLGGNSYTHAVIDYGSVVQGGLLAYERMVLAGMLSWGDASALQFHFALSQVLLAMRAWHERIAGVLKRGRSHAEQRRHLRSALARVPLLRARSFYEGLVAVNWLYYLDGCDSLGRVDQVLGPLYERDLAAGTLTEAQGEALVRALWSNVDANDGWNACVGGSQAEGSPAYNRLSVACLRAAGGRRRPNLALRLRKDAPDDVWEAALDTLASGTGLPALYNEEAYLQALAGTGLVAAEDRYDFAFGGCTETMIQGHSNVGSLDAGINLPLVLAGTVARELGAAGSFDSLLAAYERDVSATVARLVAAVSEAQRLKAEHQPQLLRTLFTGDCLRQGVEYNAGGARYNWSVINVGGLSNVVDALAAVREVVFERGEVSGAALAAALAADFVGHEDLRLRLGRCPRFGNDDARADDLAAHLSRFVFAELARYRPWRGGRFLPGCLMFVTYAEAGRPVPATADGRRAGAPIADSAGPVAGRDRQGPTALMRSLARLDWQGAPGTLVVNLRLGRELLSDPEQRPKARALIEAYFALGNMQLQINVVDQETLRQAIADPESHRDLIVRIGGYSEYFHRLGPDLQRTVLERTVYR